MALACNPSRANRSALPHYWGRPGRVVYQMIFIACWLHVCQFFVALRGRFSVKFMPKQRKIVPLWTACCFFFCSSLTRSVRHPHFLFELSLFKGLPCLCCFAFFITIQLYVAVCCFFLFRTTSLQGERGKATALVLWVVNLGNVWGKG